MKKVLIMLALILISAKEGLWINPTDVVAVRPNADGVTQILFRRGGFETTEKSVKEVVNEINRATIPTLPLMVPR